MLRNRLLNLTYGWVGGLLLISVILIALKANPVSSQTVQENERPSAPTIQFTQTVGLDPSTCATTDTINVVGTTNIVYCFAVKNTGDVTFTRNTLTESRFGTLLSNVFLRLEPGEYTFFTATIPVTQTTVSTASWDAYDIENYTIDDTAPYNFIDISSFGETITVGPNGSENVQTPDNFNIQIYDRNNHHLRIATNGVIRQSAFTGTVGPMNVSIPVTVPILNNSFIPYWDDLDITSGAIYHGMTGTAPNRSWIVQYDDVPHYNVSGNLTGTVTFQAVMTEGVAPIKFQYADVDFGVPAWNGGQSATIGLQKNKTTAVEYSYNTASITNGMAILFIPYFITATDTHTATVIVTPPPAPSIELTKTVGLNADDCASSSSLFLPAGGDEVFYCYEVTNTGNITLSIHTLNDDVIGNIFDNLPHDLGPGQSLDTVSAGITVSQFITQDTINTGLWLAYNLGPTNTVTATAAATVTVDPTYRLYLPSIQKAPATSAVLPIWLAPMFVILPSFGFVARRKKSRD